MKSNRAYAGVRRIPNSHYYEVDSEAVGAFGERVHIRKKPFLTAEEAAGWLAERKKEISDGADGSSMAFAALADRYLAYYATTVKRSSAWTMALLVEHSIKPPFDGRKVRDAFSPDSLDAFRRSVSESPNTAGHKNRVMSVLSRISDFGMERDIVSSKEWKAGRVYLKPFKDEGSSYVPSIWAERQYSEFASTFDRTDKHFVIFELLFATGMRVGEALALQVRDFDPKKREVSITKTATSKCGTGRTEIQTPKTKAGRRSVLLPEEVASDLSAIISLYSSGPDSFIFWGQSHPTAVNDIRTCFNAHIKKAGLPHIRLHEIRHSYNSWAVEKNHDPEDIAAITKRLGRSSIKVTLDTYYHAQRDTEKAIVRSINLRKRPPKIHHSPTTKKKPPK